MTVIPAFRAVPKCRRSVSARTETQLIRPDDAVRDEIGGTLDALDEGLREGGSRRHFFVSAPGGQKLPDIVVDIIRYKVEDIKLLRVRNIKPEKQLSKTKSTCLALAL